MLDVSLYGEGTNFGFQASGIRFGTTGLVAWAAKRGVDIAQGFFDTKGPNGSWQPLHEFTSYKKGSTEILMDTRDMRNSIHAVKTGPRTWAVVCDSPIAPFHEFGVKIKVTPKMRDFLHSQGLHLSLQTTHLVIPRRAFMGPAADQLERELSTKTLQGKMGDWLVPIRGVEQLV